MIKLIVATFLLELVEQDANRLWSVATGRSFWQKLGSVVSRTKITRVAFPHCQKFEAKYIETSGACRALIRLYYQQRTGNIRGLLTRKQINALLPSNFGIMSVTKWRRQKRKLFSLRIVIIIIAIGGQACFWPNQPQLCPTIELCSTPSFFSLVCPLFSGPIRCSRAIWLHTVYIKKSYILTIC